MPFTEFQNNPDVVCKCVADNAVFEIVGQGTFSAEFEGSLTVATGTQIMQDGRHVLPLSVKGHSTQGDSRQLGQISVDHDGTRPLPLSVLRQLTDDGPFPAAQEMWVNIFVSIKKIKGITLRNVRPGLLINPSQDAFPPSKAKYDLQFPLELEAVDNPGQILAKLVSYTAIINP